MTTVSICPLDELFHGRASAAAWQFTRCLHLRKVGGGEIYISFVSSFIDSLRFPSLPQLRVRQLHATGLSNELTTVSCVQDTVYSSPTMALNLEKQLRFVSDM